MRRMRAALALVAHVALAGCASAPRLTAQAPPATSVQRELEATPFFPQQAHQCGPAALATVLGASGVDTTPAALIPDVYVPALHGSLQLELLAASRRAARIPYAIDPTLAALVAQNDAGRPVLVLQNLGLRIMPRWHYAVVVGYSLPRNAFVLRSGRAKRRIVAAPRFARSWARAGGWGIVLLAPGEMPAEVDRDRYVAAVAAFERAGAAPALPAWQRAYERWPQNDVVLFAFANALFAAGEPVSAERCYRALVARAPANIAARNNLALLLSEHGCARAADAMLQPAFDAAGHDPRWTAILDDTRAQIAARAGDVQACAEADALLVEREQSAPALACGATDAAADRAVSNR
jgi:tetratricopeptide (TPR) repeat protein